MYSAPENVLPWAAPANYPSDLHRLYGRGQTRRALQEDTNAATFIE